MKGVLDEKFHAAIPEIAVYLQEGIGNSTRIDYGTGNTIQIETAMPNSVKYVFVHINIMFKGQVVAVIHHSLSQESCS